ncbi:vacuolar transporter chaperone complex subunit, putative [Bodo saltans]|uniref:Vacuolar transporter chaperone complex subunit, putative n=1 Tax=Bodo saltans TaxID=75058 RepID=A0A0S4JCW1_BODSA|nr:vacuolar transporter chaperone complex subunit, putative [Bodo saltans]|eukprot:CUG87962.1 vacuolar transporter chaperone complex subunit, putative [Bodo saltans]
MKFGELLAASLIGGWEAHYFDYWKMKDYIKRNTMELEGHKPVFNHEEFVQLFQKEERRVVLFVNGKLAEIVNDLEFQTNRFSTYNPPACQEIGAMVIKFDRFVNDAMNAQSKILKKYCKWTGQNTSGWFDPRHCSLARAQNIVHSLVVSLSSLSERQWDSANTDWVPPETFQRKTVKYWVRPEHATATKLFLIQHLPILEVNKTPSPPRSLDGEKHSQIHNYLSSVYMDNDAADCYHRRIALEEGANLLRVRWYGGDEGPDGFPRPNGGSVFFMELKTHHNPDISGQKSTKERFPITAQMIPAFMTAKLTAAQVVDAMIAQGHIKASKGEEQKDLANFIQNMIVTLKLKPWIRTVYHRTAFQRSDSNEVRVSFDLPLILHPEPANWDGKNWMDLFKVNNSNAKPFGYGVLEVKTSDEPPMWVQELLATGWLILVEKFSKFQHATATFHNHAVRVIPYWIGSDIVKTLDEQLPENTSSLLVKANQRRSGDAFVDFMPISGMASMNGPPTPPLGNRSDARSAATASPVNDLYAPLLLSLNNEEGTSSPKVSRPMSMRSTFADVMRSPTVKHKGVALPIVPILQQAPPPPNRGTNLTRMRVEPKVFFANERTFLKWMFAVVILISVSMTVMSISSRALPYGATLLITACVLIMYALGLYRWRLHKILNREGTRLDDRIGPFLIAFCLLAAAATVFAFAWTSGEEIVFECQRSIPNCAPIVVDADIDSLSIYATQSLGLADSVTHVQTCITVEERDPATGDESSSTDNGKKTPKPVKQAKPAVVWDLNNTFLIPSSNLQTPELAYLKFEEDLTQLSFLVRNDSIYYPLLIANANHTTGVITLAARAICGEYYKYAKLTLAGVAAPPTTVTEVNALFGVQFFTNASETLTAEWELRSRYTFANVAFANAVATVTILPKFNSVDDRALQTNAIDVQVVVELVRSTATDTLLTRYSTMRQAQSFIQALYKADVKYEKLQASWKR